MTKRFEFKDIKDLKQVLEFISNRFKELRLDAKEASRAELVCEEALMKLIGRAAVTSSIYIYINVRKFLGDISVELKVPGDEIFNFNQELSFEFEDDELKNAEDAIRDIILRSFSSNISYKHRGKFNHVRITAMRSPYSEAYRILASLALAVLTGLIIRNFMTPETALMINAKLFEPIRSIFMNGLKMCSLPVIFFSVIACFAAGNADLTQMKRLGVRLFSMFELLQIISALVGIGAVWLFSTGRGANLTAASANIALSAPASLASLSSLRDVFINAMPGNLLKPFLEDNILQLMILGILTGIAASSAGAKTFTLIADDLRKIFAKIVSYILRFTVLIVFCSVASAIITAGLKTLLSVIAILLTMAAAFLALNLVLYLMIAVLARLNPLKFYKKSAHVFMVGFSIASSNAVMPDAMQSLEDMGVSPKVYSFAIPFGMALSKLINPMYMFISILSVANMYGIDIKFETLLSMFFSIVFIIPMLPGIPGMMISMMSSFFALAGCPVEGVAFIMAIDTIAGMIIKTQGNVLGVTVPALFNSGPAGELTGH